MENQKKTWEIKGTFQSFEEADGARILENGRITTNKTGEYTKVRMMGPRDHRVFVLKVGKDLPKKED